MSLFSQENLFAFTTEVSEVPEKVSQNDDAASTASGASSSPVSLPSSPERSEVGSPLKISSSPEASSLISPEALKDLPSLGSLGHCAGLCKRCCFHEKGRCLNGYNCRFCHFDHDKRQRKKKIDRDAYGLSAAPVHRQLENRGFHNEAWGTSMPPAPSYVSAPPGLELPCPPPPPLGYPVVNHPAPMLPPTAPPALPAPTLLGPIAEPAAEAPQTDASQEQPAQELPICAPCSVTLNPVEDWSIEKVLEWLTSAGLSHLSQSFEEHRITGDVLLELTSSDLEEIGIKAFGDKKRVLKAVAQLKAPEAQVPPPPCWQAPALETTSPWGSMAPLTPPPSFDA